MRDGLQRASGPVAVFTEGVEHRAPVGTVPHRVLSIDGGGLKGVMPAAFLAQIEEVTEQRIVDHFDLVVGTSTGGIVALGIGLGLPCREIVRFYRQHGPKVFGQAAPTRTRRWMDSVGRGMRGLVTSKHRPDPLLAALRDVFGERRLGESATRLVIPAWNSDTRHPCLFKTAHHPRFEVDYARLAADIAMATAAAPTYLPAHSLDGVSFLDGGIWANNPAIVAAVESVSVLGWAPESTRMLSLGCTDEMLILPEKIGLVGGLRIGVDMLMQGQALAAQRTAEVLLGGGGAAPSSICRVDVPVAPGFAKLDDATRMEKLEGLGRTQAREWLPRIRTGFLSGPKHPFVPCREVHSAEEGVP